MGRTVPSFRMVIESEIAGWSGFRKALVSAEDREAFDALMDMCRNNAMASGAVCNPIPFEPMIMSILLAQQKKILKFEKTLDQLKKNTKCQQNPNSSNTTVKHLIRPSAGQSFAYPMYRKY